MLKEYISEREILEIVMDLIRIESHKNVSQKELNVAQYIYSVFEKENIEVSLEVIEKNRPNVYAYLGDKKDDVDLLFNGHIDTVPGFTMDYAPFKPFIRDGNIYGRGSADMKGAIGAMIAAFIAIKREGLKLTRSCMFSGVIDEEERSKGTEQLIKNGLRPKNVIIGEATELNLCTGHKGMEWIEVTFVGKATHGSRPEEGTNAIYMASEFCNNINNKLQPMIKNRVFDYLGNGSINVGKIMGGDDPNIVPDTCIVQMDRRWLPQETLEDIQEEISIIAREIASKYNGKYKIKAMREFTAELINRPYKIDDDHPFVQSMKNIVDSVTNKTPSTIAFPAWSDAGLLSYHTRANCVILGPGNINQAHANNEFCSISDILLATEIYYSAIKKICF